MSLCTNTFAISKSLKLLSDGRRTTVVSCATSATISLQSPLPANAIEMRLRSAARR